jgi:transposase-like protein
MPQCTICTHEERQAIDAALLAGETSLRNIAKHYDTSAAALYRHKGAHLPAAMVKAQEAVEIARADNLLDQVKQIHAVTLSILAQAEKTGELRVALTAVREARGNLELLAKLLGELQAQPTVNVLVASPEWTATRARLIAALGPYPEARAAVLEAIREH